MKTKNLLGLLMVAVLALVLPVTAQQVGYVSSNLVGTAQVTGVSSATATNTITGFGTNGRRMVLNGQDLAVSIVTSGYAAASGTNVQLNIDLGFSVDGTNFSFRTTGFQAGHPATMIPGSIITVSVQLTNGPTVFLTNIPAASIKAYRYVKPMAIVGTNQTAVYVSNVTVGYFKPIGQ